MFIRELIHTPRLTNLIAIYIYATSEKCKNTELETRYSLLAMLLSSKRSYYTRR
jgi:hypothetical protein